MDEITTKSKVRCPNCGSENYGVGSGEPVQMPGWYADRRFAWGRYAGVQSVRCTGLRCHDCGHVEAIDPDFD